MKHREVMALELWALTLYIDTYLRERKNGGSEVNLDGPAFRV